MEAQELKQEPTITQKIQLVNGIFTPTEAAQVILNLIEQKINFHKIQRLQKWEANHNFNTETIDRRIKELKKEKRIAQEFMDQSNAAGKDVKINGVVELSYTK